MKITQKFDHGFKGHALVARLDEMLIVATFKTITKNCKIVGCEVSFEIPDMDLITQKDVKAIIKQLKASNNGFIPKLITYTVSENNPLGLGTYSAKGFDPEDCYNRLSKKRQKYCLSISNEDETEVFFPIKGDEGGSLTEALPAKRSGHVFIG